MSSTDTAAAIDDTPVATTTARPRRRVLRILGVLTAVIALAFASTSCTPRKVAQDAIVQYWGSNYATCAELIVKRESGFNAAAVNPSSGTTGLFQIHPTHATWIRNRFGYAFSEMKDPYKNAQVAKALSAEAHRYYGDGWQPWRLSGRAAPGGGCPA